mgnify:CR=1 FL=1
MFPKLRPFCWLEKMLCPYTLSLILLRLNGIFQSLGLVLERVLFDGKNILLNRYSRQNYQKRKLTKSLQ